MKTLKTAALCATLALPTIGTAQGVPTIDTKNLLQQLQTFEQMLVDAGLQNDQLSQLIKQVEVLEQQLAKLDEIKALLSDPSQIIGLAMGGDLDGILEGDFDGNIISTILSGSKGDWSGITGDGAEGFKARVDNALTGAGTSAEKVEVLASSDDKKANRLATGTTSNAATSAAAEIAYEEAGKSVTRTTQLVEEIGNMKSLKQSVDHNTRVTAELAIAMAALWQLESVQTMNVGLSGVLDAATLAEIEKFLDFTQPEFN